MRLYGKGTLKRVLSSQSKASAEGKSLPHGLDFFRRLLISYLNIVESTVKVTESPVKLFFGTHAQYPSLSDSEGVYVMRGHSTTCSMVNLRHARIIPDTDTRLVIGRSDCFV